MTSRKPLSELVAEYERQENSKCHHGCNYMAKTLCNKCGWIERSPVEEILRRQARMIEVLRNTLQDYACAGCQPEAKGVFCYQYKSCKELAQVAAIESGDAPEEKESR